jgi:hypothetical protein
MSEALQSGAHSERSAPSQRVNGRFAPGVSGNPGGRSRRTSDGRTLAQLARDFTEDALRALHRVVLDPCEPTALRVQAAAVIAQRGWGDAPKLPDADGREFVFVVKQLTVDAAPTAGVLRSPIEGHCALPSPTATVVGAGAVEQTA